MFFTGFFDKYITVRPEAQNGEDGGGGSNNKKRAGTKVELKLISVSRFQAGGRHLTPLASLQGHGGVSLITMFSSPNPAVE